MTYRLNERRRRVLRDAAARGGRFHPMLVTGQDLSAFEELGLANTIDDCGHAQGAADPCGAHRSHRHTPRLNDAGFAAATTADGALLALTTPTGRPLPPLALPPSTAAAPVIEPQTGDV
ncbi:hypothetical protein [Streptomyces europaeiscabiei]|uniref:hypothetical protein n=1 Tax=Streptomyces europaeiscabiei TaxID=146819 RepID=UPI0038F6B9CE